MTQSNNTLLDRIKNKVAKDWFAQGLSTVGRDHPGANWESIKDMAEEFTLGGDENLVAIVCERYAAEKAKEGKIIIEGNCIPGKSWVEEVVLERDKGTMSSSQGDYRQFEGKDLHITTPESSEPQEKYTCNDCGAEMNEGEAKTFTVCDSCFDKHYSQSFLIPKAESVSPSETEDEIWREALDAALKESVYEHAIYKLKNTFSITRLTPLTK